MTRPDSTGVAVVDDNRPYFHISTCPIGMRVTLRGLGGVAVIGSYNGRDQFWTHWAPLPVLVPGVSDVEKK